MIELTEEPIDCARLLEQVSDATCGGQVLFLGTTRRWTKLAGGKEVETEYLQYEAYREMALAQMKELAESAQKRWPVKHVAIVHRLGRVEPSESSVGVAVSSPHRSESFEAAKWLIDELKHEVPIWKQEHYVQQGAEWIHPTSGSCSCDHHVAIHPDASALHPADAGSRVVRDVETLKSKKTHIGSTPPGPLPQNASQEDGIRDEQVQQSQQ
jgi:molybdopterin synthase catalytic subunit